MDERFIKVRERLYQSATILLIVLSCIGVAGVVLALQAVKIAGNAGAEQQTISVSGRGEIMAVPNIAEITYSVVEEGKTADVAQEAATKKSNDIIAFLKEEGIEDKDVKTVGYNLSPKYEYYYEYNGIRCASSFCPHPYVYKNEIVGYTLTQSVEVKVRDLKLAGNILSGIGSKGASNLSGIQFVVEDEEQLKEDARALAITDARAEAKRMAKELGVRLGKIISFSEGFGGYPTPMMARGVSYAEDSAGSKVAVPEVPAGEQKIISTVNIVYSIK